MSPYHPRTQLSFNLLQVIIYRQCPAAAPPSPPPTSPSGHALFVFIITVFLSFVQIKFAEPQTSSPFETHHTTIMVFLASLILYCSSLWAIRRFPSHAYVLHVTMRSAGLLALASLLSLLLPDSWHSVPYLMLLFYFIGEFCQLLPRPWQLTCRQVIHGFVSRKPHGRKCAVLPLTFMDLPPMN